MVELSDIQSIIKIDPKQVADRARATLTEGAKTQLARFATPESALYTGIGTVIDLARNTPGAVEALDPATIAGMSLMDQRKAALKHRSETIAQVRQVFGDAIVDFVLAGSEALYDAWIALGLPEPKGEVTIEKPVNFPCNFIAGGLDFIAENYGSSKAQYARDLQNTWGTGLDGYNAQSESTGRSAVSLADFVGIVSRQCPPRLAMLYLASEAPKHPEIKRLLLTVLRHFNGRLFMGIEPKLGTDTIEKIAVSAYPEWVPLESGVGGAIAAKIYAKGARTPEAFLAVAVADPISGLAPQGTPIAKLTEEQKKQYFQHLDIIAAANGLTLEGFERATKEIGRLAEAYGAQYHWKGSSIDEAIDRLLSSELVPRLTPEEFSASQIVGETREPWTTTAAWVLGPIVLIGAAALFVVAIIAAVLWNKKN